MRGVFRKAAWTLALVALFSAVARAGTERIADRGRLEHGFIDARGERQGLAKFAPGEALLLVFWASWCGPCVKEIPAINHVYERFSGRGLRVVGVNVDFLSPKLNAELATKYAIRYPLGSAEPEFVMEMGVEAVPSVFLYAPDGKLFRQYHGAVPADRIEKDVADALKKTRP